jgi:hypothetical protein
MPGCAAVGCSNSAKKGFIMKKFPKDAARRKGINGSLPIIPVYVRLVLTVVLIYFFCVIVKNGIFNNI